MSTSTSFSLLLTLALALPGAAALGAETAPAGGTPVPLVIAVADAPSLAAARARAQAAGERLGAAGRFPDPQIEGMFSTTSTPGDDMTMWEVAVRQPLPKAGERAADRDRAAAALERARADFALMSGETAADVALALAEAETARRRADALASQIARTEQVLSAVDARIATGRGRLADRLALQTRIAVMRLASEQDSRMAEDALSEARSLLGLRPDAPLPAFSAPPAEAIDTEDAPALYAARAGEREARAMARMARASARPMTAVGVRFEREKERMGNNDTVGIAFMTELPWRGRRYARAEARAARAEARAASAEADGARHRIAAALSRVERAERLAALSRRLAEETLQRLDADYDMLVRSTGAASGEAGVLMILDVLEQITDAHLQVIDAEGSVRAARAELWRHAPARFFPLP